MGWLGFTGMRSDTASRFAQCLSSAWRGRSHLMLGEGLTQMGAETGSNGFTAKDYAARR